MIQARRSAIRTMTHSGSKAGTGQKLSRSSPASGGSGPGILTVWRKQGTRDPTPCTVSFQGCAGIPVRSFSSINGKSAKQKWKFSSFPPSYHRKRNPYLSSPRPPESAFVFCWKIVPHCPSSSRIMQAGEKTGAPLSLLHGKFIQVAARPSRFSVIPWKADFKIGQSFKPNHPSIHISFMKRDRPPVTSTSRFKIHGRLKSLIKIMPGAQTPGIIVYLYLDNIINIVI